MELWYGSGACSEETFPHIEFAQLYSPSEKEEKHKNVAKLLTKLAETADSKQVESLTAAIQKFD